MPLTTQPLADLPPLESLRRELLRNVPESERTISVFAGIALVGLGLAHRSIGGGLLALLGGALIRRGVTGKCEVYDALGHARSHRRGGLVFQSVAESVDRE